MKWDYVSGGTLRLPDSKTGETSDDTTSKTTDDAENETTEEFDILRKAERLRMTEENPF